MFNLEEVMELKGIVKKFQFTNPHTWLHVSVAGENGEETVWRVEYLSPNILKRKGWNRKTFQVGDEVTVNIYPAKSGDPKGGLINAITADGKMLGKPVSEAGEGPAIK
jgi:outer membrane usher protein FimD/PapC